MKASQDIIFGVAGQVLVWDAPEGRPTGTPTAQVFLLGTGDDGTAQDALDGDPEIDAVSTTVDAASGYGEANPRRLNVASTTGVVPDRSYLVTSADGLNEWVDVIEVDDAGEFVTARYPMANPFTSGDAFVGTRLTVPLKTLWVSDKNKLTGGRDPLPGYRVRWLYTVGGVDHVHDAYFDLVRYVGGHTLKALDVDREYPGIAGMGPGFHRTDGYKALLDQAYERVRWDLTDVGTDDNAIMDQDALNRATLLSFGVVVARSRVLQGADQRLLELAQADYEGFMNKILRSSARVATAVDSSGSGAKVSTEGLWARR